MQMSSGENTAHLLIIYAHVLICICTGRGSRHFSAFHFFIVKASSYSKQCITNTAIIVTIPSIMFVCYNQKRSSTFSDTSIPLYNPVPKLI